MRRRVKRPFDAAVAAADWRTLTELIEAARLQAQPDIEGDPADIRSLRTAAQANASHASAAERPDVSEGVPVPPLYGIVIRDAFEGRSELLVPPEVTVLGHRVLAETRHRLAKTMQHIRPRERSIALEEVLRTTADLDDALVWSSWIEGGAIYWTLAWGSTVIDGGVLRPEDAPETFAAIAAIAAAHDVESPWFNPGSVDVVAALEDADGPEEQLLTQPLSALLPEPLRSALLAAEEPRDLVMAVAPEIAFLPWPIIAIEEADIGGRRLVEAATLRFVPSATALEAARRWLTTSNGSTPFLVACDNPTGDLIEVSPRAAFRRFGAESRTPMHEDVEVATALAVIEYLRTLKPGTPGLAFFRGHASWDDEDPTQSSLVMAGGDSIPAGLFFVRDAETGGPAIPLPSTVILSCCSTSGVRGRRGGESLGLVAGCLAAGASRVFATNVDVVETPFTNALDDMLIEIALDDGDQFAALRELQLKLLNEWRDSSTRWSGSLLDAAHPIVWAH
jgi:hypothetical protein